MKLFLVFIIFAVGCNTKQATIRDEPPPLKGIFLDSTRYTDNEVLSSEEKLNKSTARLNRVFELQGQATSLFSACIDEFNRGLDYYQKGQWKKFEQSVRKHKILQKKHDSVYAIIKGI